MVGFDPAERRVLDRHLPVHSVQIHTTDVQRTSGAHGSRCSVLGHEQAPGPRPWRPTGITPLCAPRDRPAQER